ncbi:MAG: hypothetical protein KA788_04860 [Lacunisphaera sp.]|jgi:hypothetical protein|nr:hypothetical protein [Lacunisphaera sp.]
MARQACGGWPRSTDSGERGQFPAQADIDGMVQEAQSRGQLIVRLLT